MSETEELQNSAILTPQPGDIFAAELHIGGGKSGTYRLRGAAIVWDQQPVEPAQDGQPNQRLLVSLCDSTDTSAPTTHCAYAIGINDLGLFGVEQLEDRTVPLYLAVLTEKIGTYTPLDPNLNSVEITRAQGYRVLREQPSGE